VRRSDQSPTRRYLGVAQRLLDEVAAGRFVVGARLPADRELATRFDVSRATVREALLALELIGAIEVRHGDGTYLRGPRAGTLGIEGSALDVAPRDLIETRRAVEPIAASLAATRIGSEALDGLTRDLDEATELVGEPEQLSRYMELGLRFHAHLAHGCGNALLAGIVAQLVDAESHPLWVLVNQHAVSTQAARQVQLRQHRDVLAAVSAGRGDDATRLMGEHLLTVDDIVLHPTDPAAAVHAAPRRT